MTIPEILNIYILREVSRMIFSGRHPNATAMMVLRVELFIKINPEFINQLKSKYIPVLLSLTICYSQQLLQ
jgi:hypothetical protein